MVTWSGLLHVLLSFLSYSIKLLAVQELLDKEALEKVNILFFLPHQQNPDPRPEAALTAEGACFFVLPTVSLADPQSKPPATLVHTSRPKLALSLQTLLLSSRNKNETSHVLAFKLAVHPSLLHV